MLQDLRIQAENVSAGLEVFDRHAKRTPVPGREWEPRNVFVLPVIWSTPGP